MFHILISLSYIQQIIQIIEIVNVKKRTDDKNYVSIAAVGTNSVCQYHCPKYIISFPKNQPIKI